MFKSKNTITGLTSIEKKTITLRNVTFEFGYTSLKNGHQIEAPAAKAHPLHRVAGTGKKELPG